jgi:mono/diheme cytochrome c family protein
MSLFITKLNVMNIYLKLKPIKLYYIWYSILLVFVCFVNLSCSKNTDNIENKNSDLKAEEYVSTFSEVDSVPLSPSEAQAYIKKGQYLAEIAACGVCHSKTGKHNTPLSGGRILFDNYGKLVSPNITPDKNTGIGLWTIGDIKSAIRESVGKDGHKFSISAHQNYRWISDEDTLAIAIYLQSLEAVKNDVSLNSDTDKNVKRWSFLNSHTKFQGYVPNLPEKSAGYRGLYLVTFLQGCSRCHSPKDRMGDKSDYLNGFKGQIEFLDTSEKVEIPSIRDNESGIKSKTEGQIISHLSKINTSKSESCPTTYYSNLSEIDKKAVAVYLKSLK